MSNRIRKIRSGLRNERSIPGIDEFHINSVRPAWTWFCQYNVIRASVPDRQPRLMADHGRDLQDFQLR